VFLGLVAGRWKLPSTAFPGLDTRTRTPPELLALGDVAIRPVDGRHVPHLTIHLESCVCVVSGRTFNYCFFYVCTSMAALVYPHLSIVFFFVASRECQGSGLTGTQRLKHRRNKSLQPSRPYLWHVFICHHKLSPFQLLSFFFFLPQSDHACS